MGSGGGSGEGEGRGRGKPGTPLLPVIRPAELFHIFSSATFDSETVLASD